MKEIKAPFGTMYIEELGFDRHNPCQGQEEEDRIKVYDSDKKYLDYWSTDTISTQEDWDLLVECIEHIESLQDFDDTFMLDVSFVGTKEELLDYCRNELFWENTDEEILQNEYINRVGDTYILVSDWVY